MDRRMRDREPTGSNASPAAADPAREAVSQLASRLGLDLQDPQLALAALTHKSYVNEHRGEGLTDNERLEFLGDAVIDLAVSHRLMERFPDAREGELSKIRASLVDESGLAGIARQLDLGPLLRLGRGEEITGGRQKASLLADAFEAVIAALYLCGGLAPVLALIDRLLGEAFARAAAGTLDRDYKTQLQELSQSRLRATPRYRVVAEHGPDHSKTFEVELEIRGEALGRGRGRSKKDAEQAAAKLALEALGMRFTAEAAAKEAVAGAPAPGAAVDDAPAGAPPGPRVVSAAVAVATGASVVNGEEESSADDAAHRAAAGDAARATGAPVARGVAAAVASDGPPEVGAVAANGPDVGARAGEADARSTADAVKSGARRPARAGRGGAAEASADDESPELADVTSGDAPGAAGPPAAPHRRAPRTATPRHPGAARPKRRAAARGAKALPKAKAAGSARAAAKKAPKPAAKKAAAPGKRGHPRRAARRAR
jgi:ribonuclease-3